MNLRLQLLAFLVFFSLIHLSAQVGFSIPAIDNAQPGTILDLPITVTNFDSIVSAQFVVRWDPSVLSFQSVGQFALPDMDDTKFGLNEAVDSGFIRVVWWFYTAAGTSRPDNSAIFHLKLKVIGPVNSGTSVYFTQIPPLTFFEVVKADNTIFNFQQTTLENGFVAVGYTPATSSSDFVSKINSTVFPNPFNDKTQFLIDLKAPALVRFSITDISGKFIYETQKQFPAGSNGMEIVSDIFNKKGIYFLIIRVNQFSHVETLLFF